jgi:hypothetical protein
MIMLLIGIDVNCEMGKIIYRIVAGLFLELKLKSFSHLSNYL